jgi:CRP-like cAMP-binding protein
MNRLDTLFQTKKCIEVNAGKIIVYEGHQVNKIYRIVSGYVKVYTIVGAHKERILFIYKKNDIFPLTTFLSGHSVARFFYEAVTPTTLQHISPKQLEAKLLNNLMLGEEIVRYTQKLDRKFLERVNDMVSGKSSISKIKSLLFFLAELAEGKDNRVTIALPISPKLVAAMSGMNSQEALRQLRFLKSKDIISISDGLVIDTEKLKKLKA